MVDGMFTANPNNDVSTVFKKASTNISYYDFTNFCTETLCGSTITAVKEARKLNYER